MNIYKQRFKVACDEARRVNALLAQGYLGVLEEEGSLEVFNTPFEITEREVLQRISKTHTVIWHLFDPAYDNGSHTPVPEIRQQFREIRFYQPVE